MGRLKKNKVQLTDEDVKYLKKLRKKKETSINEHPNTVFVKMHKSG